MVRPLAFFLLLVLPASATSLQPGDLVLHSAFGCPCGFTFYSLVGQSTAGELRFEAGSGEGGDVLYAPDGTLYVGASYLCHYAGDGRLLGCAVQPPPTAVAMDRAGNILAITLDGILSKYDHTLQRIDQFQLPRTPPHPAGPLVSAADLASDQCSLFYLDGAPRVHRYDVCARQALPDLDAPILSRFLFQGALRVADNGDILVASGDIRRISPDGRLLRIYPDVAREMALSLDGRSLWVGSKDVRRIDIESGEVVAHAPLASTLYRDVIARPTGACASPRVLRSRCR